MTGKQQQIAPYRVMSTEMADHAAEHAPMVEKLQRRLAAAIRQ